MGEQGKNKGNGPTNVIVGGKSRTKRVHLKLGTLIISSLILFVLCAAIAIHLATRNKTPVPAPNQVKLNAAIKESYEGNTANYQKLLDEQLVSATTPTQKVEVYTNKMGVALDAKMYDQAISFGTAAEKIKKTTDTAQIMAQIYIAKGDMNSARQWLQLAIDRLDKTQPAYDRTLRALQTQLAGLNP